MKKTQFKNMMFKDCKDMLKSEVIILFKKKRKVIPL